MYNLSPLAHFLVVFPFWHPKKFPVLNAVVSLFLYTSHLNPDVASVDVIWSTFIYKLVLTGALSASRLILTVVLSPPVLSSDKLINPSIFFPPVYYTFISAPSVDTELTFELVVDTKYAKVEPAVIIVINKITVIYIVIFFNLLPSF